MFFFIWCARDKNEGRFSISTRNESRKVYLHLWFKKKNVTSLICFRRKLWPIIKPDGHWPNTKIARLSRHHKDKTIGTQSRQEYLDTITTTLQYGDTMWTNELSHCEEERDAPITLPLFNSYHFIQIPPYTSSLVSKCKMECFDFCFYTLQ